MGLWLFGFILFNVCYFILIIRTDWLSSDFSTGLFVMAMIYWLGIYTFWRLKNAKKRKTGTLEIPTDVDEGDKKCARRKNNG